MNCKKCEQRIYELCDLEPCRACGGSACIECYAEPCEGHCQPDLRTQLEKVRDELKSATDLTETHQYGYFKAANALRMLEAILEGRGE